MRFIFGIIIGIALTLGVFYVHDSRVASAADTPGLEPPAAVADGEIVNWDVLGHVAREQVAFVREQFNKLIGG